ncbi:MAG: amidohydrolase family protein [Immundisolibacterales bacterium]|nr:amidohydrolase family protein [Immundisolibacterales bacterium]
MKLWDPHFHLWDVSPGTTTGHDPSQLFAADGDPLYDRARYESDLAVEGFELTGGALVEAVSVCHVEVDGPRFARACVAEARWVSSQLAPPPLDYVVVASAALEDTELPAILRDLADCEGIRGIRQIVNHEPSWPRNERRGDLLDRPAWQGGLARLEEFGLSFDLQLNPHQFRKAARLLARHPGIPVVIGHLGSPTLDDLREGRGYWDGLEALADLEQAYLKISMLSYPDPQWDRNPLVRESVHRALELFGVDRCMFASNFPVEKHVGWPVDRLYAAFRGLVSRFDESDRQRLFADNARRAYRAPEHPSP